MAVSSEAASGENCSTSPEEAASRNATQDVAILYDAIRLPTSCTVLAAPARTRPTRRASATRSARCKRAAEARDAVGRARSRRRPISPARKARSIATAWRGSSRSSSCATTAFGVSIGSIAIEIDGDRATATFDMTLGDASRRWLPSGRETLRGRQRLAARGERLGLLQRDVDGEGVSAGRRLLSPLPHAGEG